MHRKSCLSLLFLLIVILAGCTTVKSSSIPNTDVPASTHTIVPITEDTQITELKKQISSLQEQLSILEEEKTALQSSFDINTYYKETTHKKVLTKSDADLKLYPSEQAKTIRKYSHSLVDVLATVSILSGEKEQVWLYIQGTVFDTPVNSSGWVLEGSTEQYSKFNQDELMSPVTLRKGGVLYDINTNTPKEQFGSIYGIDKIEDGYAYIYAEGGWQAKIKKEDIVYPGFVD
jgi:hypothetical protein